MSGPTSSATAETDMNSNDDKKTRILNTAAEFFARLPYHKVLLSEVASEASVGKGTLYLYFKSKDDLYYAVLFQGFRTMVEKMRHFIETEDLPADQLLTGVIRIIINRLYSKSINTEMLGGTMACPVTNEWNDMRFELWGIMETILRRGVEQDIFEDANPRLTAQYIPSILRSICLFKPAGADIESIYNHTCNFVLRALAKKA